MKKLLLAVFLLLPAAVSLHAQQDLESSWQMGDLDGQHRIVTDNSNNNTPLALVGAGSINNGSVSNSSLTIDGKQVNINSQAAASEAYQSSSDQPTRGAYLAGGAVFNNTAANNALNISNTTLTGRDAFGGAAILQYRSNRFESGSATGNTVNISNTTTNSYTFTPVGGAGTATIGGNVYGGYSEYAIGSANNNTVSITNGSVINGNVYGGMINDHLSQEDLKEPGVLNTTAEGNTVYVKDSTVNGTIAGAAGATTSNGNTVIVENSTVDQVFGVDQSQGIQESDTSVTYANNNTVTIKGSTLQNAAAVSTTSINASGNTLTIEDSSIANGSIYAVNMQVGYSADSGNPVAATVGNNHLNLTALNGTFSELGASLNLVGTASGNSVNISGSQLTLNNTSGKFFGNTLNLTKLNNSHLLDLTTENGILFGGAGMTYTSQTNAGPSEEAPEAVTVAINGTNSDNNTIQISGGNIDATILGGFAAYINEVDYSTVSEDGKTTTIVKKDGLTTTTTTITDEGSESESEEAEPDSSLVYSASNNTVILDGVNYSGTLYGGYVYGAEITEKNMVTKNNTVILRGNVDLDLTAVLYGGNNAYYANTNKLVFDRTVSTFYNREQFKNFNNIWTINADFDTNTKFDFEGVYAEMTLDKAAMKEGSATVVSTQTQTDLSNIQQGEKVYDLTDNGIELVNDKMGVYSYDLTGVRGADANTVEWILTSKKDSANVEVYGQLPLVGLALATEGVEMLSHSMADAWKDDNDSNTFLNGGYHHTRYETGSGFDLDSGVFQAGAWKKLTADWMGGVYAKYGSGSYDTYPIKVSGNADVYAGGLMTSYRYSETGRVEASVEVGYMNMEFTSGDLVSAFKSNGIYYGANAGFVENLIEDLNLYANINWLHKGSDTITDNLDQKIKFDSMQSLAMRFGADYAFTNLDLYGLTPSVGALGIYEFDGKSAVIAEGVKNDEASMKGISGRAQIGLEYHSYDTYFALRTALTVYGQAGKREGWGAEANITFEF